MTDIYLHSPAWMRPEISYPLQIVGYRTVGGKKEPITEYGDYITERVSEFTRPKIAITNGPEDPNSFEWVADIWDMLQHGVPWARIALGPTIAVMDAMGQWHSPKSAIADCFETIEGSDLTYRITTLAVSTNQSRKDALSAALALQWRELEAEATHEDAFGPEWAREIDDSLAEAQAAVLSDPTISPESRRVQAFVTYCLNLLSGGGESDRAEDTPLAYQRFQHAAQGDLGRLLAMYRNGLQ